MSLTCRDKNTGETHTSFLVEDAEAHRIVSREGNLVCRHCGGEMVFTAGKQTIWHYRHKHDVECPSNESREHLQGKMALFQYAQYLIKQNKLDAVPVVELSLPNVGENGREADVAIVFRSGFVVALECQLSAVPLEELKRRTLDYNNAGVHVAWFWGDKTLKSNIYLDWSTSEFGSASILVFEGRKFPGKKFSKAADISNSGRYYGKFNDVVIRNSCRFENIPTHAKLDGYEKDIEHQLGTIAALEESPALVENLLKEKSFDSNFDFDSRHWETDLLDIVKLDPSDRNLKVSLKSLRIYLNHSCSLQLELDIVLPLIRFTSLANSFRRENGYTAVFQKFSAAMAQDPIEGDSYIVETLLEENPAVELAIKQQCQQQYSAGNYELQYWDFYEEYDNQAIALEAAQDSLQVYENRFKLARKENYELSHAVPELKDLPLLSYNFAHRTWSRKISDDKARAVAATGLPTALFNKIAKLPQEALVQHEYIFRLGEVRKRASALKYLFG